MFLFVEYSTGDEFGAEFFEKLSNELSVLSFHPLNLHCRMKGDIMSQ